MRKARKFSGPQREVLQVLANAAESLCHDDIRARRANGESPTATLQSLERRGLVTCGEPHAGWLTQEWFGLRWAVTAEGRAALDALNAEAGGEAA